MKSSSLKDTCALLGFSDLHSFKDYVVFVLSCAPDLFPPLDWEPEEEMTLQRAFEGLRFGFDLTADEIGKPEVLARCRQLVEEAYGAYKRGADMEGQRKLEEVEKLLKKITSP